MNNSLILTIKNAKFLIATFNCFCKFIEKRPSNAPVCVCVCVRERGRERDTERETERQRETERDRERLSTFDRSCI